MDISLYPHQERALRLMHNGCILNGDVGSGKSRTSIAYYYTLFGGKVNCSKYVHMKNPCDLYIITIASKRDKDEWEPELNNFLLTTHPENSIYDHKVVVDSWNNIKKYREVEDAFFIFDEQKVGGYGAWTKSFLQITKNNRWILLSATPGDKWEDYEGLFIAHGYFRNKTDMEKKHAVYARWSNYPKITSWINEPLLMKYKRSILVNMDDMRKTVEHHIRVDVGYDVETYNYVKKNRWNPFKDLPIANISEYCQTLRHITYMHITRQDALLLIHKEKPRVIVFYNFDYELDILIQLMKKHNINYAQWNGHKHEPVPTGDNWIYLVEYMAGAEGWNCTRTDTMVFFSENYSYRIMKQSAGRINRINTKYIDLYYYHFRSKSDIDMAVYKAIQRKKKFNEADYCKGMFPSKGGKE